MHKKFTHSFVEEQKEKPAEIVTERKDENGKSTYDVSTPFHDPNKKTGSLLVFSKFSHSLVCGSTKGISYPQNTQ